MGQPDCLPYDIEQPVRSEAVLLAAFAPSDGHGFTIRLCRYPTASIAWLWVQSFLPDGSVHTFNIDHLPCGSEPVDPDRPEVDYRIDGVAFERSGDRNEPASANVRASVRAHASSVAPDVPGRVPLDVAASFVPFAAGGPSARGRSEVHGRVSGTVTVDGVAHEITGVGQWHEQLQDQPRFRAPFTYACLIGERESVVGVVSGDFSRGTLREVARSRALGSLRIEPRGDRFLITADDRSFTASVTHRTTIPLYGLPWHGTRVIAEGNTGPLAGMINSFDPSG